MKYLVRLPVYLVVEEDNLASARARASELARGLNVLPSLSCNSIEMTVWDEKSDQLYPKVYPKPEGYEEENDDNEES